VEDVVARYVQARGGFKKIRAIETLRQSGRVTAGANRTGLAVRELKRPNRSRQVRGRPVQMQTTYGEFKETQGALPDVRRRQVGPQGQSFIEAATGASLGP
jgi:hypothetical protein